MAIRLTGSQGTWVLPEGETLFGRSTQCGICLLDARLSRRHAGFHVQGSRLKIRDLGSTNGVLVNGKPVLECGEAQHGDQVVVGPCLLTVRIDDTLAPDTVTSLTATLVHEPSPWEAAAPPSRHLNPQIAAAIAPGSDLRQHESETETHQPSDSHHPDTKAVVRHTRESLIANEERAAIQSRLGWLNKEMGNTGTASRYFGRARGGFTPLMTYSIIAVTVVISLMQTVPVGGHALVDLLELDKLQVMRGEYWRLLTVALVHGGVLHLLMNMYALWIVGPLAEALYGRALFLAIYLTAALGGSVASFLALPNPAVGASGAVFGLFGLVFAATFFHKPLLRAQARAITSQIGVLIVINLLIGFGIGSFARIDNAAHIGGLLVGGWLGLLIAPAGAMTLRSMWQRNETSAEPTSTTGPIVRVLGIIALGAVLVGALLMKPLWA